MLAFHFCLLINWELQYLNFKWDYELRSYNYALFNWLRAITDTGSNSSFVISHWLFAFNYWTLSLRVEY